MRYLQKEMIKEISNRSELTVEEIKKFIDRDFYIRPEQAIEFGLCDGIIERLS
jgi:ATP-dependent protease ClpP protease subunit